MAVETKVRKSTRTPQVISRISLANHAQHLNSFHLLDLFNHNPARKKELQISCDELTLDFSHQRITAQTLLCFEELATQHQLHKKVMDLVCGFQVNTSEDRPALHTALRDPTSTPILVDGKNIKLAIRAVQEKMANICQQVWQQGIQDVLVLGIGGSYWGSRSIYEALQMLPKRLNVHFLADIEPEAFTATTASLCPEKTLVIIISKSFTTREVLITSRAAQTWLGASFKANCFAVTAAVNKAQDFGVTPSKVLEIWPWVGGRYSIWSAVGIPIALCYGMDVFYALLNGAYTMDQHLTQAPVLQNLPMMAALLTFLNTRFFTIPTMAVIPYSFCLNTFIPYIQQLVMESLGKCHDLEGKPVSDTTGPIIWGQTGLHAQHTFNQLLYQGKHPVMVDFILPMNKPELVAHCFAQSQALAFGDRDNSHTHARILGNQPHNLLKIPEVSAKTLGLLMAFYEHQTYLLACLFNINAFDQFGVELAKNITKELI